MKPKEPLIAAFLSLVYAGFGQIYAGRIRRGIAFICINLGASIFLISYLLHSETKLYFYQLLIIPVVIGFAIFAPIDAYKLAKSWNVQNDLKRKISKGKRVFWIGGILFVLFVFNPIATPVASYIRADVVQAFQIPSAAMSPTLMIGDRLFVDKSIYDRSEPQRGDVIVFEYPVDPEKHFIKRLVGLPSEVVEIKESHIVINGIVQTEGQLGKFVYYNDGSYAAEGQSVTVPSDSYFVLGDNSANSRDSRYWGFVPRKNLVGKAYKIYWPLNRSGRVE